MSFSYLHIHQSTAFFNLRRNLGHSKSNLAIAITFENLFPVPKNPLILTDKAPLPEHARPMPS